MRMLLILFSSLSLVTCLFAQKKELTIQTGHSLSVNNLCFSADGKLIASCGDDNLIILWDVLSGKQIRAFVGHTKPVNQTVFHPNNNYLASVSDDNTIKIWDINTGENTLTLNSAKGPLKSLDYSYDGKFLVVAGNNIEIWNTVTWENESIHLSNRNLGSNYVKFSYDGSFLAIASQKGGIVFIYDIKNKQVKEKYKLKCKALAFSPDGRYLAGAGIYGKLRRWDLSSRFKKFTRFSITENKWIDSYLSVAISPDIKYFAGGNQNNRINIYDLKDGKTYFIIKGHQARVNALAFSPDGLYLASAGKDRKIHLWDVSNRRYAKTFKALGGPVNHVAKSKDGSYIAIGDQEGYCKVVGLKQFGNTNYTKLTPGFLASKLGWRVAINEILMPSEYPIAFIKAEFYREIKKLHSFKIKRTERFAFWDINSGKIDFIKSKKLIQIHNSKNVYFLNLKKKYIEKYSIAGNTNPEIRRIDISALALGKKYLQKAWLNDNEDFFVTNTIKEDTLNSIEIFNLISGEQVFINEAKQKALEINFMADNRLAIAYDNNKIQVIDLKNGTFPYSFKGKPPMVYEFNRLAFLEDNETINIVNLSDSVTHQKIKATHSNSITCLEWLNEDILVSSSSDGSIKLWSANSGEELITLVTVGNYDNMFITPENYYLATKGALSGVGFNNGTEVYSFEQFDLKYNRPDIVLSNLGFAEENLIDQYKRAYLKRLEKLNLSEEDLKINLDDIPVIELNTGEIPISTKNDTLIIRLKIKDEKYTISNLQVIVEGVPEFGKNGMNLQAMNSKNIDLEIPVLLSNGKNSIQISARNKAGIESMKKNFEINYQAPKRKPDLYLIAIGVSEYIDKQFNLNYAAKDAKDIVSVFLQSKKFYSNIDTILLLDENVTLENFKNISERLKNARVDDVVIMFLAGHGIIDANLDYYFASHDIDFYDPASNGIPYNEIELLMDNIRSRKKILFIDACHSGEFDKSEVELLTNRVIEDGEVVFRNAGYSIKNTNAVGSKSIFELSKLLFADFRESSGTVVVSSAGGAEYAIEGDKWKNGVFTYSLLKGLNEKKADLNKDGKILISELQRYVFSEVFDLTGGKQQPTTRVENLVNDFRIW